MWPLSRSVGPTAGAGQPPDRLAALDAGLVRVGNLHHLDVEADLVEVVGVKIGDAAFLEGRARDADGVALKLQEPPLVDCRQNPTGINGRWHPQRSFGAVGDRDVKSEPAG